MCLVYLGIKKLFHSLRFMYITELFIIPNVFAYDTLLYREIRNLEDAKQLQKDLTTIENCTKQWQMQFNPKKCIVQRVHKCRRPVIENYHLMGHVLESLQHSTCLGVEIETDLSWNENVKKITSKANKALGFVRRNMSKCPIKVKEQAYTALVRPPA